MHFALRTSLFSLCGGLWCLCYLLSYLRIICMMQYKEILCSLFLSASASAFASASAAITRGSLVHWHWRCGLVHPGGEFER